MLYGRRGREESKPPSVAGRLPSAASAQLGYTRSSGSALDRKGLHR
jgi:hypothetical protein